MVVVIIRNCPNYKLRATHSPSPTPSTPTLPTTEINRYPEYPLLTEPFHLLDEFWNSLIADWRLTLPVLGEDLFTAIHIEE